MEAPTTKTILAFVSVLALGAADARAGDLASPGAVADSVRAIVGACHPASATERIEVHELPSLTDLTLDAGERILGLEAPRRACEAGRVTFLVVVQDGERIVRRPVAVEVRRYVAGLAPVRDLGRGVLITSADVQTEWFDLTYAKSTPLRALDPDADLVLAQSCRTGTMLTGDHLAPAPLVRRGSMVTIVLTRPGFRIRLEGRARDAGASGETIRVTNPVSGRVLHAKVVGPGVVEI